MLSESFLLYLLWLMRSQLGWHQAIVWLSFITSQHCFSLSSNQECEVDATINKSLFVHEHVSSLLANTSRLFV